MRAESASSRSVPLSASAWMEISLSPVHSALQPMLSSSAICVSTSRMRGTLERLTSSSVRRQAARIGSAAFLFPATVISPERGVPPWMTNLSIWGLG